MPKQITTLSIFLASPSDVAEERKTVNRVVNELNLTSLKSLNLHLELINWENSTYPSFGIYPQAVINEQIGSEYDIFLGILWSRFGTPTPNAQSGTLEEFERAYARIHHNTDLKICIYFKTDPIDPYKIDISQLQKVRSFKDNLTQLGGYHWEFTSENFEETLRRHLFEIAKNWNNRSKKNIPINENYIDEINHEEDIGIYDLYEEIIELFKTITDDLNAFNDLTINHNTMIHHYTEKLDENPDDFKARKKIINNSSDHMNDYSYKAKLKFSNIQTNFEEALKKFNKFLEIYPDIHNQENALEFTLILNSLDHTISAIPIMIKGNKKFLEAVKQIPRMTTNLTRSKKLMISTLEPFIEYIENLELKLIKLQKKGFELLSSLSKDKLS